MMTMLIFLSILLVCLNYRSCHGRDNITAHNPLKDNGETLVSAGKKFELGFFSPEGKSSSSSSSRYLGIWYYGMEPQTVVWTANREKPLLDSTGVVEITKDGQLKVLDANQTTTYFSTEVDKSTNTSDRFATLQDSGNLVLSESPMGPKLWRSFEKPTDTFLPGMKMNENLKLTSWVSDSNPGSGNFTFQQDQGNDQYTIKMKTTDRDYWRSGELGNFFTSTELPSFIASLLTNFSTNPEEKSPNKTISNYTIKSIGQNITRLLLNSSGQLQYYIWYNKQGWYLKWAAPYDNCSVYNFCGIFSLCSSENQPVCECLQGFEPNNQESWKEGDFSSGCKPKSTPCYPKESDTFLNFTLMKVGKPDEHVPIKKTEDECKDLCFDDCKCRAYSFIRIINTSLGGKDGGDVNTGCWIWNSDLKNLQHQYSTEGLNLSFRVAGSEIVNHNLPKTLSINTHAVIIVAAVIVAALVLCSLGFFFHKKIMLAESTESAERMDRSLLPYMHNSEERTIDLIDEDDTKGTGVSLFKLESILAATENFSDTNKLGEGGFGPVYRGMFPGEQPMAVKRLSSHSGQGMQEFKNEVVLIAKLQHRNLVRLLGYCVERNEKILVYEYMPNKSLDAFLFDEKLCTVLDWKRRFDIILGIARGLLYLHQDSRLRIIHRDLKTSNILLDEEMNPKISDFGLARIVEGTQTEANTNRVVGTYGYMSPEYALEGLFSVKSDIFSFGVILLEMVSGERNTGFYQSQKAINLLGHAWRLWKEDKALDLLDNILTESYNTNEVLKSIKIGLLCVQEDPSDRPTMGNVVAMLGSEFATIPSTNQPAYIVARNRLSSTSSSSSSKPEALTHNMLTISMQEGR